jgi:CubicO group peptidase (beta-lactamase class C family)
MTRGFDINGSAAAGFESVTDAFALNFERGDELGARFSAYRAGEMVVDIWAGFSDREKNEPWSDETLVSVYSSGKAAMAALVAEAVAAGKLSYDAPVAALWPEFAANGKGDITLAMVLSHQAGLCGFPEEIPPQDWVDHDKIAARLAAMAPLWASGSASGYHPQTGGFIVNEVFRRATGETIGAALQRKGLDIHCGVQATDFARIAHMTKPPSAPVHRAGSDFTKIAFLKPWSAASKVSREEWLAACMTR